jgi:LmbE family N-acetylglucosaminyl deacetylase
MMTPLQFASGDRLLVFAPHPDDETLATGELIQSALASGAAVRVVFATDGDNNPWPQRWLERRWSIGAAERARWGTRRRDEAGEALTRLGIDCRTGVRFLGWPDQGLTEALLRDDDAIDLLGQEICTFAPTHVAMPALADRHPDHSALRVMLELALLRSGSTSLRLGYVVHGTRSAAARRCVPADAGRQTRKQYALQAYVSQMSLSGRRLSTLAEQAEEFEIAETSMKVPDGGSTIRIPRSAGWGTRQRHDILLVIATAQETLRFRVPVETVSGGAPGSVLAIEATPEAFNATLPFLATPLVAVFAKVHRKGPRLVIFDRQPWLDASDLLRSPAPITGRQAAPGFS